MCEKYMRHIKQQQHESQKEYFIMYSVLFLLALPKLEPRKVQAVYPIREMCRVVTLKCIFFQVRLKHLKCQLNMGE